MSKFIGCHITKKYGILNGLNNRIKKADHNKFLKNYHISYIIKKYINLFQKNN